MTDTAVTSAAMKKPPKPTHDFAVRPSHQAIQVLALVLTAVAALAASLAFATPAPAQEPVIQEIRIGVQDLDTKRKLEQLPGGGTLKMEVGDRVRLRMVAIPGGRGRAPRYPSTRFWALAGAKRISLSNIDVETGSVDVTAVSTVHPGNNQATTLIAFEIEEDLEFVKPSMRGGTITVEVVEPPAPEPEAPVRPERPGSETRRPGITLFEHQDFQGVSEFFDSDVRDLRGSRIQPDRASSVRIDRGCEAILYEHPDFRGRSTVVTGSIEDLNGERVGNDTVSAIELDCSGRGFRDRRDDDRYARPERGITLYEHQDFGGDSEFFDRDVRDLRGTRIGPDRASSVEIDRGCEAILYEHPDFQGRSTVVTGTLTDLNGERVGNDTVSSIELDCSGRGLGQRRDDARREAMKRLGATLYDDTDFRGSSETFFSDARDLRNSRVGDNRARSVRVDPGCRAILWTGPDYRGDSLVVDRDLDDLSRTRIGFDEVSSVEVDCR